MKYLRCLILGLIIFCSHAAARESCSCSRILKYVEERLPQYGVLKNSGSFLYLDVDDAYIHKLISLIQEEGFEEPPYFGSPGLVGAHITVIYPDEMKKLVVGKIEECGQTLPFAVQGCEIVHPPRWQKIDEVYVIVLAAPELEKLREKYGLPKQEFAFHLTIGVKPKVAKAA